VIDFSRNILAGAKSVIIAVAASVITAQIGMPQTDE
jgi:hypothetical protein